MKLKRSKSMRRLYVIVRSDLPVGYQMAQSGHAIAQFYEDFPDNDWKNHYLLILSAPDEEYFEYAEWKLKKANIEFSEFFEPDLDNQKTSIAFRDDSGKLFSKLNLAGNDYSEKDFAEYVKGAK